MNLTFIVIAFMIIWLPIFIYSEYKLKNKYFIFTKTFSSILFLLIGILGHFTGVAPRDYSIFIIVALSLGLIGDVLLVYSDYLPCFMLGLLSFLVGQIVYGTLFFIYCGFSYYDLILYAVIVSLSLLVYSKSNLQFGKMKIPGLFYMLTISFMFTMAVSLIYKGCYSPLTTAVIVVGATLFAISDIVLTFNLFDPESKPVLKRVNLGLYYSGQMILASSIITFYFA